MALRLCSHSVTERSMVWELMAQAELERLKGEERWWVAGLVHIVQEQRDV